MEFLFNTGFFKTSFGTMLYLSGKKDEFEKGISCIELMEAFKAWIIRLPVTAGIFSSLNRKSMYGYVQNICAKKNIGYCLVPQAIREEATENGFQVYRPDSGKLLFKCLLMSVIEEIYTKAGKRLEQLDMVIVPGGDAEELIALIQQLEPCISFISVVSQNKEELENTILEPFEDTGLSITISADYRNRLKNADIILNLGSPHEIAKYRLSRKTLMINLNDLQENMIQGDNPVINNISVEISDSGFKNLMYDLHGYFSRSEVYDLIISKRLGLDKIPRFTIETSENIKRDFKRAGLRISGLIGRRGSISTESVIKAVI